MRSAARTLSITARRYIVSSIIQKMLTYSATVIRMTRKQSDRIDAQVFAATFGKLLAPKIAAFALVLKGHLLHYPFAATCASHSDERYFVKCGTSCVREFFAGGSKLRGVGPVALFLEDIQFLGWYLDVPSACVFDTHGKCVWRLGHQPLKPFQQVIRMAYRHVLMQKLAVSSSVWKDCEHIHVETTVARISS